MNKSSKKISKSLALISIVAVIIVSLCTSLIAFNVTTPDTTGTTLDNNMQTAVNAVSDYETSLARNNYLFTDELFSKANIVASTLSEKSTAEEAEQLARYLYADSIIVTDTDGKCVVSYPADLKDTNISDNDNTKDFRKVLKGTSFKSQSEPQKVENSEDYFLYTCVGRPEGKGVVIIGTTVTDYGKLLGSEIADDCNDNTIIANGDEIVSSSFAENDKTSLKALGVTEENLKAGSFSLKVNDKEYICKAQTQSDFTIISLASESTASNVMTVLAITLVADIIVFVIFIVLFARSAKKNKA
ncbi:MAG: hypothetical protein UHD05_03170 [Ruminococcus sp.]|nr:hypothetical protein [Ruminococcus sp.]